MKEQINSAIISDNNGNGFENNNLTLNLVLNNLIVANEGFFGVFDDDVNIISGLINNINYLNDTLPEYVKEGNLDLVDVKIGELQTGFKYLKTVLDKNDYKTIGLEPTKTSIINLLEKNINHLIDKEKKESLGYTKKYNQYSHQLV